MISSQTLARGPSGFVLCEVGGSGGWELGGGREGSTMHSYLLFWDGEAQSFVMLDFSLCLLS